MKKIISLLITVILCTCMFAISTVSAAGKAEVVMGTASGKTGDTVAVDMTLKTNPGFGTLGVTVSYDKTKLELVSVTDKKVFTNGDKKAPYKNTATDSMIGTIPYLIAWQDNFTLVNTTGTGKLATFHFKILGKTSEQTAIVIAVKNCFQADMAMTNVASTVTNGSVKISGTGVAVSSATGSKTGSTVSSAIGSPVTSSINNGSITSSSSISADSAAQSSQTVSSNNSDNKKMPSSYFWQIIIMATALLVIVIISVVYVILKRKID